MTNAPINTCPACNGTHLMHIYTYTDGGLFSGDILQCADCGLHIHRGATGYPPPPPYNVLHYPIPADNADRLFLALRGRWLQRKARIVEREAGRVSGVMLDAGCMTGEFIATMRHRGWIAHGIEACDTAREYGNTHYGLHIEAGNTLYRLKPKSYNVVTAWDTLGRSHDPERMFATLSSLITGDGTLILALYNPAAAIATHYGATWHKFSAYQQYLFTPAAVEALASRHGMQIVRRQKDDTMAKAAAAACRLLSPACRHRITALPGGVIQACKAARREHDGNGLYMIYTLKHNTSQS